MPLARWGVGLEARREAPARTQDQPFPAPMHHAPAPLPPHDPQLPNGEVTSEQLRYLASVLRPYGADGCGDVTTRANLQVGCVRALR